MCSRSEDDARRERAKRRAVMPGEVIRDGACKPNLYAEFSPIERFAYMSSLCRAQWEAKGRTVVKLPRAQWPGEIFENRA